MSTIEASPINPTWSSDIHSTVALAVDLRSLDGYWTALEPRTGIFGTGADESSALEDLIRALQEHTDVLARQEALSDELADQLDYLRQRLS